MSLSSPLGLLVSFRQPKMPAPVVSSSAAASANSQERDVHLSTVAFLGHMRWSGQPSRFLAPCPPRNGAGSVCKWTSARTGFQSKNWTTPKSRWSRCQRPSAVSAQEAGRKVSDALQCASEKGTDMPEDLWQRGRDKDHAGRASAEYAEYGRLVSYERIVDKLEVPKKKRKTKKKRKNVASRQQPTVIGIGSRVLWGRTQFYVVARNDECLGIARRADGSVETWIKESECRLQ
jgi:hypothetical protein